MSVQQRLDVRLVEEFELSSRSLAQSLIKDGKVKVNQRVVSRSSSSVNEDDELVLDYDSTAGVVTKQPALEVVYEDEDCVVINKPIGLLTHSKGAFNPEPTVATWLAERLVNSKLTRNVLVNRAGIVHRLDRGTSGAMICAKNDEARVWLQKQFSQRKVKKTYIALVEGYLEPKQAVIDMPIERNPKKPQTFRVGINGKPSVTEYNTEKYIEIGGTTLALLKLMPQTGRTHQLRVHLKYLKHPIVGDTLYGGLPADRMYLHALSLELTLPNKQRMTFSVGLPKEFDHPGVDR